MFKNITDDFRLKRISWERFLNHTTYLANENGFVPWQFNLASNGFIKTFQSKFRFHPIYNKLKNYLTQISNNLSLGNFTIGNIWSEK